MDGEKVEFPKSIQELAQVDEVKADKVMRKINESATKQEKMLEK